MSACRSLTPSDFRSNEKALTPILFNNLVFYSSLKVISVNAEELLQAPQIVGDSAGRCECESNVKKNSHDVPKSKLDQSGV